MKSRCYSSLTSTVLISKHLISMPLLLLLWYLSRDVRERKKRLDVKMLIFILFVRLIPHFLLQGRWMWMNDWITFHWNPTNKCWYISLSKIQQDEKSSVHFTWYFNYLPPTYQMLPSLQLFPCCRAFVSNKCKKKLILVTVKVILGQSDGIYYLIFYLAV